MLLAELTDYLSTNGVGTAGTDLFYGFMPDTPNAAVALYEIDQPGNFELADSMLGKPG